MPDTFSALTGSGAGSAYQTGDKWGYQTAEKCRQNFNVLKTASDLSTGTNTGDVTLAGTPNYLTLAGQVITRALINLASHVTGRLPYANLVAATAASRLLGRTSASAGDWQEVTLGTTLALTATVLDTTSGLITVTVPLTNAQIKNLPTTPITLVATPGASKMLVPVMATFRSASTAAGYTGIDTTYAALSVSYLNAAGNFAVLLAVNSSTSTPDVTQLTDLLGTSDNTVICGPYATTPGDEGYVLSALIGESAIVNQPLVLAFDNNGGAGTLGGGNVANFGTVTLTYRVI